MGLYEASFTAMNSPCQLLIEANANLESQIQAVCEQVANEALRIEHKFSRYRDDNQVHQINQGQRVETDAETQALFAFAGNAFEISEGLFDITSGILRRIWNFKNLTTLPTGQQIQAHKALIGWQKVNWAPPFIQLNKGMEIDLGGIGKEYAVDKCRLLLSELLTEQNSPYPFLLNFGGDLCVSGPRLGDQAWITAIENPAAVIHRKQGITAANKAHTNQNIQERLTLKQGAIATSGTARQHIIINGKQYGHILNPKTGMPVENAPLSITVAAPSCIEAGMLSTLAMLQGEGAEDFLLEQGVKHWIKR